MGISKNSKVKMHYKLSLAGGESVETSEGDDPIEFTFGAGQIIEGLERHLEGLEAGEEKRVEVEAADGYGERDDEAVVKLERGQFPEDDDLEDGMILTLQRQDGMVMRAVVLEANDAEVTLDLNHPLAGKKLVFDIKILEVG